MKKTPIFFIFSLILPSFLLIVSQAEATTDINISNNGDGATSHVSVQSNTSTNYSNTSGTTTNGHTTVRIESNGEVKTYEGDGNQSVHLQSSDGKSQVNINNNTNSNTNSGLTQEQIDQKKADVKKKIDEEKAKIKATITSVPHQTVSGIRFDLGAWLRSLFSSFFGNK